MEKSKLSANQVAVSNRLAELGISSYNQHRHIVEILGSIITPNETIEAVVIGRNANHTSALFALTQKQLFYIVGDKLYHSTNQIALSSLMGVTLLPTPILSSVTIESKAGEFCIMDANNSNADFFTKQLNRVISQSNDEEGNTPVDMPIEPESPTTTNPTPVTNTNNEETTRTPVFNLTNNELEFISQQHAGILTTASASGDIHTNPVYYVVQNSNIYILTRKKTHKAQNMVSRPQATLAILNNNTLQYVTINALSQVVSSLEKEELIYNSISEQISKKSSSIIQNALYDTEKGEYTVFQLVPVSSSNNINA